MIPVHAHLEFDTLEDLLSDRLDEPSRRGAEAHLAGCRECRGRLDSTAANLGAVEWIADALSAASEGPKGLASAHRASGPDATGPISLPERLGHFRIIRELGRGGRGVVFLAEDARLRREVALKVLSRRASDAVRWEELQAEAQALAALDHPAVARIHSLEVLDGVAFLCLEWVRGETLGMRLQRGVPPLPTLLSIARRIASGLEAAHQRGVVHLDLKPQNIVLSARGTKILDFGLARFLDANEDATFALSGTPGFMSPEQVRGEPTDARADVWAFGCVLYACLTGKPPFGGAEVVDRWAATLDAEPDWTEIRKAQTGLQSLVRACLQKNPAQRPASGAELVERLDRILETSVDAARIPVPSTSWIGRAREMTELRRALDTSRLVTVTGTGGVGKSRLALEAMRVEGSWRTLWVELASIDSGAGFLEALAAVLGARSGGRMTLEEAVLRHLTEEPTLLVLDNCEHLVGQCAAWVARALTDPRSSERLRFLATSREALRVPGETTVVLGGLDLQVEARLLFEARAREAWPALDLGEAERETIDAICQRLEGVPLALELAAANLRRLPLEEIERRLRDDLDSLGATRDPLRHHRTLDALFDWSYERLRPDERAVFTQLSVFRGGWTLEAAQRIVVSGEDPWPEWRVGDLMARLIDASLIELAVGTRAGAAGGWRYRMLEPLRMYAARRYAGAVAGQARHRAYYAEVAEDRAAGLTGFDQERSLHALAAEADNLRGALRSSLESLDLRTGLRLTAALGRFWQNRGWFEEGAAWCEQMIEAATGAAGGQAKIASLFESGEGSRAMVSTWVFGGIFAAIRGDAARAHEWIDAAENLARTTGSDMGLSMAWNAAGGLALQEGRRAEARDHFGRALEVRRRRDDRWGVASLLNNLAVLDLEDGRFASSRALAQECLQIRTDLGDRHGACMAMINLANVDIREELFASAGLRLEASLSIARSLESPLIVATIEYNQGRVAARTGELDRAAEYFERSRDAHHSRSALGGEARALEGLAEVSYLKGDARAAKDALVRAAALYRTLGDDPAAERVGRLLAHPPA